MKNFIEHEIIKGWNYLTQQNLDKAEDLYKVLNSIYEKQESKDKIKIKKYLVRVNIAKKEWKRAKENLKDIMNIDSNIAEIHKLKAMVEFYLNNYKESEREFKKSLDLAKEKKDEKEIKEIISEILVCLHEYTLKNRTIDLNTKIKILNILKEINLSTIYSLEGFKYLEKIYFNLKEYSKIENLFILIKENENIRDIIDVNSNIAEIHELKAMAEFYLNNYKESEREFKISLELADQKEKTCIDILEYIIKNIEVKKYITLQEEEMIGNIILEIDNQQLLIPNIFHLIAKINLNLKRYEMAEKYFIKTMNLLSLYKQKRKIYMLCDEILSYLKEYLITNKKYFESENVKKIIEVCSIKRYYEKLFDLALLLRENNYYRKSLHILFALKRLKNENHVNEEIINILIILKKYGISEKYINTLSNLKLKNSMLNKLEIAQRKIFLKSYPTKMTISLISSCNLRCKMCPYNKDEFFQLLKYQVDDIIKILPYLEEVEWNGGEVFLFKYFNKLLVTAYKNKVKQHITSNGLLINDMYAKKIVNYDVDLTLSIDSVNKKLYENIRVGASFDILCENISMLNYYYKIYNKRPKVSINAVLSKWNYNENNNFIDILLFAKNNNFCEVRISMDLYEIDKQIIKNILLKFERQKGFLINLAKELKIDVKFVIPNLEMKTSIYKINNTKSCICTKENDESFCFLPFKK